MLSKGNVKIMTVELELELELVFELDEHFPICAKTFTLPYNGLSTQYHTKQMSGNVV